MNRHVVEERLNHAIFRCWPFEKLEINLSVMVFVAFTVHNHELRIELEAVAQRLTNVGGLSNRCYHHKKR